MTWNEKNAIIYRPSVILFTLTESMHNSPKFSVKTNSVRIIPTHECNSDKAEHHSLINISEVIADSLNIFFWQISLHSFDLIRFGNFRKHKNRKNHYHEKYYNHLFPSEKKKKHG